MPSSNHGGGRVAVQSVKYWLDIPKNPMDYSKLFHTIPQALHHTPQGYGLCLDSLGFVQCDDTTWNAEFIPNTFLIQ
jgi:RNA:NAD 2'-phosphotransferase (TPT1/KptA family)